MTARQKVAARRWPDSAWVDDYEGETTEVWAVVTVCGPRAKVSLYSDRRRAYTAMEMMAADGDGVLGLVGCGFGCGGWHTVHDLSADVRALEDRREFGTADREAVA